LENKIEGFYLDENDPVNGNELQFNNTNRMSSMDMPPFLPIKQLLLKQEQEFIFMLILVLL
jgi:hypothetical protein